MSLSPQQRRFLYTHSHPSVQSVKQRESAAYIYYAEQSHPRVAGTTSCSWSSLDACRLTWTSSVCKCRSVYISRTGGILSHDWMVGHVYHSSWLWLNDDQSISIRRLLHIVEYILRCEIVSLIYLLQWVEGKEWMDEVHQTFSPPFPMWTHVIHNHISYLDHIYIRS